MNLNNLLKVIGVLAVLILAAGLYARLVQKQKPPRPWGMSMRDMIDDPEGAAARFKQQAEDPADRAPLDDAGMQEAAASLLDFDQYFRGLTRLDAQGTRAVPVLKKCLTDPRYQRPFANNPLPTFQVPVVGVLDMLGRLSESSAVPLVTPLTQSSANEVRAAAYSCLCKIGTAECVEPVQQALASKDKQMRTKILNDIHFSLQQSKLPKSFGLALFDPLLELLKRGETDAYMQAVESLMKIDPPRTLEILGNEDYVSPKNKNLPALLSAFNRTNIVLPPKLVQDILPELKAACDTDPDKGSAYGECLIALAKAKDPGAEALALDADKMKAWHTRRCAAEALCIIKGIPDPAETAFLLIGKKGVAHVPVAVRQYAAVRELIDEVSNGGLTQYFFNSAGDESATALEGLTNMGLESADQDFQRALAVFGSSGPSPERRKRQKQLKRFMESSEDPFEKLGAHLDSEEIEVKTLLFVVTHAADFKDTEAK